MQGILCVEIELHESFASLNCLAHKPEEFGIELPTNALSKIGQMLSKAEMMIRSQANCTSEKVKMHPIS